MTLLLLIGAALAAECPEPVGLAAVERTLDEAEAAFASLDPSGFAAAMDTASFQVPCVDALASPGLAARLHRLTGLRWFTAGQEAQAAAAFHAAAVLEPGYRFPEQLLPAGHAARRLYEEGSERPARTQWLPEPVDGQAWLDGAPAEARPEARPTWFQLATGEAVVHSAYVAPADAWPAYEHKPPPKEYRDKRPPIGFAVLSGAAFAASGVLYGAAARSAADFEQEHPDYDLDALRAHRARTNTLVGASAGSAGLGLALGLTFAVSL